MADEVSWSDLAPDSMFRPNAMAGTAGAPHMIDDRGMVGVNRGLVRSMKESGFTHATPQYAGTGTTYLHGTHPDIRYPVTMRFSTHAHDVKEGGSDRPFGEVRGEAGRKRLHYDIDTTAGPEKFRQKLNEMQQHLQQAAQPGGM